MTNSHRRRRTDGEQDAERSGETSGETSGWRVDAAQLSAECPLCAAGSTDRCNTFRELVCSGLIEQGLSGPFIELPCYRAEFGLAM
jgi:hypothetical protein